MITKVKENKEQEKINKELLDFDFKETYDDEQLDLYLDPEEDKKYDKTSFKKIIDSDDEFSFKDNEEKINL